MNDYTDDSFWIKRAMAQRYAMKYPHLRRAILGPKIERRTPARKRPVAISTMLELGPLPRRRVVKTDENFTKNLFRIMKEASGYTEYDLTSETRVSRLSMARGIFSLIERKLNYRSTTSVGKVLKKDHSSIVYSTVKTLGERQMGKHKAKFDSFMKHEELKELYDRAAKA